MARRPGETEDRPWAQFDIDASRCFRLMSIFTGRLTRFICFRITASSLTLKRKRPPRVFP